MNKIISKIVEADPNTFVIFYTRDCPYCRNALELLNKTNAPYKGYDINQIDGGMHKLLTVLNQNSQLISFNRNHKTKPLVFINGRFLGGYTELARYLGGSMMRM